MSFAIRVENLSKRYRIRHGDNAAYHTLRDEIVHAAGAPLRWLRGQRESTTEEFWALKDVSFEVQPGEVLGVIGRNGAGKSTLLKILSRITRPTHGRVEMRGRVGSLLEVGTGFHPELTGRENIFLSGAILGMKRAEIVKKFDEIVAFAEVERFLDTPVKRYSSGMYVRLAFSVAAHLEPDILIIDEVLAVGDAAFQKKCLGKMNDVACAGRTVVFVTHNMTAARSLCRSALWLDQGQVHDMGETSEVTSGYLRRGAIEVPIAEWPDPATAPGNQNVRLGLVSVVPVSDSGDRILTRDVPLEVKFGFWNCLEDQSLHISWLLYNDDDVLIFNLGNPARRYPVSYVTSTCTIPSRFLVEGTYRIRVLIIRNGIEAQFDLRDVLTFNIADGVRGAGWMDRLLGVIAPQFNWTTVVDDDVLVGASK